ncbi:peptidase [Bacteroidia bacterium]|nr:peptidase [Bacteroidia bacterium]GHU90774.1 peptidase [Bacteroidia bacterium]GHV22692.1 peptidase [Bacteroidia bacterium]
MIEFLKKLSFSLTLILLPALTVTGQKAVVKKIEGNPLIKNPKELTADKEILKRELVVADSAMLVLQLEEEGAEFPAEDIYEGSWNTEHVKAYGDVAIPDSFKIDVSGFIVPFEGGITSKFGPRRRRFHYGTDIKLQTGDTIRAAFDGKIRVQRYEKKGYGYFLVLRHSNGLETVYGHLSKFLVEPDDIVKAGDPIALGGNTGRSTGPHLHFEMRFLGQAIDPQRIIDFDNFSTFDDYYVFHKNKPTNNKFTAGNGIIYHRIKSGDTLGAIARKYGTTVTQLCRLNGIKSNKTLRIGSTLRCS